MTVIREKVVKATVCSAVSIWGYRVIGLILFVPLAHILGPKAFGIVVLSTVCIAMLQVFTVQGLRQPIIQCKEIFEEFLDTEV